MIRYFLIILAIGLGFFSTSAQAQNNSKDSVVTTTLKVGNLHCDGDMPTIKKRLLNQDGIDEVSFTERKGDASQFTVSYHTAVSSLDAIEKAIESTPGCDDKTETPYRVRRERKKTGK